MAAASAINRANEIIDSARLLDDTAQSAHAFRMLLGNLAGRPLFPNEEEHALSLKMVRAGILRAQIGCIMAILDPWERRGNRASIGHVVKLLKEDEVKNVLLQPSTYLHQTPSAIKLADLSNKYEHLCKTDIYQRVKRLRNDSIAHVLRPDERTPDVQNNEVSSLQNEAEGLIVLLFEGLGLKGPELTAQRAITLERATLFWDTYFTGIGNRP